VDTSTGACTNLIENRWLVYKTTAPYDSYQSKDIWQTHDGIYVEDTQIKVTCLSISYMTFVKSTHLIKLKCEYFCICLWCVLNIGTIAFYYIANLTCIATWPKYTIFGWGCHMELLPVNILKELLYTLAQIYGILSHPTLKV
jgi:hypothetical protein